MLSLKERSNDSSKLLKAIIGGQTQEVEVLLKQGENVNARTENGDTMLHVAVSQGCLNTEIVALLLKFGGDVKAKDYNGETPLQVAACQFEPEIAELLLKHSGEVNANKSRGEYSSLHMATMRGRKEIAEILLKYGADVGAKTKFGQTALHFAACRANSELGELLLMHHSDVNAKAHNGQTPLHMAAMLGRKEMSELLLRNGSDIDAVDENCTNPLSLAIAKGHRNVSEVFVAYIAKLCATRMKVSDQNLQLIRSDSYLNEFCGKCEEEINELRSERIFYDMTYYDVLVKNPDYLSAYVRKEKMIHLMEARHYYESFPIYASSLDYQFEKGLSRKDLLDVSEVALEDFFNTIRLPNQVVRRIFYYLTAEDLKCLTEAFGISITSENLSQ